MPEIIIDVKVNTSQIESYIDALKKAGLASDAQLESFIASQKKYEEVVGTTAAKAKKQIADLGTEISNLGNNNKIADTLDVSVPLAKAANGFKSLKQEAQEATNEYINMARSLGGKVTPELEKAKKRAADLRSQVEDMNRSIKLSSPEGKFQALGNVIQGAAGAMHVLTGTLQIFGAENKKAEEIAKKFQGALNIAEGLGQMSQLGKYVKDLAGTFNLVTAAEEGSIVAAQGLKSAIISTGVGALVVALGYLVTQLLDTEDAADGAAESIKASGEASKTAKANIEALGKAQYDANKAFAMATVDQLEAAGVINEQTAKEQKLKIEMDALDKEFTDAQIERKKRLVDANFRYYDALNKLKIANESGSEEDQAKAQAAVNTAKEALDKVGQETVKATEVLNAKKQALQAQFDADAERTNQEHQKKLREDAKAEREKEAKDIEDFYSKANQIIGDSLEGTAAIKKKYGQEQKELDDKFFALAKPTEEQFNLWVAATKAITEKQKEEITKAENEKAKVRQDAIDKAQTEELAKDKANTQQILDLNTANAILAAKKEFQARGDYSEKATEELNKRIRDIQRKADEQKLVEDYNFAVTAAEAKYGKDSPEYKEAVAQAQRVKDLGITKLLTGDAEGQMADSKKVTEQRKKDIDAIHQAEMKAAEEVATAWVDAWASSAKARLESQLAGIDEEKTANDDALKHRLITKEEYDQKSTELENKKAKKEAEIKRKQAQIDKEQALFGIFLKTAESLIAAWLNPATAPLTTSAVLTIAGIETAAVLAKPIPKFKKGTLSVPGHGTEDSVHALLQPGEAVIPTEINKKYHKAVQAIYSGSISPKDFNDFVNSRNNNHGSGMNTTDVYMLTKAINKNNRVNIGNLDELARHIASLNNPRR